LIGSVLARFANPMNQKFLDFSALDFEAVNLCRFVGDRCCFHGEEAWQVGL
jgi:hypothetical protein